MLKILDKGMEDTKFITFNGTIIVGEISLVTKQFYFYSDMNFSINELKQIVSFLEDL